MKEIILETGWKNILKDEFDKEYFVKLREFIHREYSQQLVYPPAKQIFAAFDTCPFDKVSVVILGQDPYHGPGQAHGLCFSVNADVSIPPSLRNIFKEIQNDLGLPIPASGDLSRWAKQGVLLLNATLTVKANAAGSHQKQGWETFTDAAIARLAEVKTNLVFLLWGSFAWKKAEHIDSSKHLILKSPHPSPLSAHRGFFGNNHFSKTNEYLRHHGRQTIDW